MAAQGSVPFVARRWGAAFVSRVFVQQMIACRQLRVQVATLEAAVTYLQQLLTGNTLTKQGTYRDPEALRTTSLNRTRSGMPSSFWSAEAFDKSRLREKLVAQ